MEKRKARRYRWTNVVVLIVSVYLLASSVWSTPEMVDDGVGSTVVDAGWLTMAYVLAGASGLLAIFLALKRPGLGRVFTALAGVLILSGFLALSRPTPIALVSLGLTGAVLLIAAGFMGPMPTPEQEGLRR